MTEQELNDRIAKHPLNIGGFLRQIKLSPEEYNTALRFTATFEKDGKLYYESDHARKSVRLVK